MSRGLKFNKKHLKVLAELNVQGVKIYILLVSMASWKLKELQLCLLTIWEQLLEREFTGFLDPIVGWYIILRSSNYDVKLWMNTT